MTENLVPEGAAGAESAGEDAALLQIDGLDIEFGGGGHARRVVEGASLSIRPGQVQAVVGESGSGKTLLAQSILQLLPDAARISGGDIRFRDMLLNRMSPREIRRVRGAQISMIFQEPMVSLNPCLKIGFQLCESAREHTNETAAALRARALELLARLRIADPETCLEQYPHEFSGGMRQRIMIAASLMMRPALLIADEPTTALDCLIQRELMDNLLEVTRDQGTAVLLISHDLGLVSRYADRVAVMERGRLCEEGPVRQILSNPRHAYTQKLMAALPGVNPLAGAPASASPANPDTLLEVADLVVEYPLPRPWPFSPRRHRRVLEGVSLAVHRGDTVAIVGESGSGKTTLGRALLQLAPVIAGDIRFRERPLTGPDAPGQRQLSRHIQLIFQDPYSSLSPRRCIFDILAEPLLAHGQSAGAVARREAVLGIARDVGLPEHLLDRYPHELSGGQRQRVAIGRALVTDPELVIADEPVSALDVTVQKQILELLQRLKAERGFSCLFISHDLGVVRELADRVVVMYRGRIVEEGATAGLFASPRHEYTRALLSALPRVRRTGQHRYELEPVIR